ncbi:MAG: glycoside hydrolase family 95 protein [Muribaculaceae bacterium]|nr:glycoside hydrolase family 95 protein [Muribaculaceae bacterium]
MTRKTALLTAATSLMWIAASTATAAESNTLWYQAPADDWMEAGPIGNGRIGAVVYGGIDRDRVALNEITLWAGQRDSAQNDYCGPERLAEIREAFFAGDFKKGNDLTHEYLHGRNVSFGTHLPLGDMIVDFKFDSNIISDYRRQVDMATAVASTTFKAGNVNYTREYICNYPDDVFAMNISADQAGKVSFTLSTDFLRKSDITTREGALSFSGKVDYPMFGPGGVDFAGDFRIAADGGKISCDEKSVTVEGANSATIYFDLRTNYDNTDWAARSAATVENAKRMGYAELRRRHVEDHSALFNRMSIDLGSSQMASLPTDIRLHLIKSGAVDPAFDALFFQYGRYMQIASSRPNSVLCSNLQGIWNDNRACHMSWTCDYHLDININQNYWSPNKANLAECNIPMFKYVALLEKYGSETAKKLYGCDGWCAHTVTNPWGFTACGGDIGWGLNVSAGAWLATELWSHFLYTRDLEYLRETGYPLLKSCAEFFVDYMVEDPNTGYLVTGPSISPENGFKLPNGEEYNASMMPTLDRQIVFQIYTACIESSKLLGIDKKFRQRLEKDIKRLPPNAIGADGQVKEWLVDAVRRDPAHRHTSHLMGLYPFGQMTWTKTPDLMRAARHTIEVQTSQPNWEDVEWSAANMLCFYTFLKDGEKAHEWLYDLLKCFTRENLMTVSPKGVAGAPEDIFSFDATEASVAGICDMLMQSHDGFIDFLPALPEVWATGSVNGICAQGGFVVDLAWRDSKPVSARINATVDFPMNLYVGEANPEFLLDGKPAKVKVKDGIASLAMKAGQTLAVTY